MIKSTYVKSKQNYKVSFELPEESVGKGRDVRVLANFNNWSWDQGLKLKNGKSKYTGTTELPAGHYQFRYLVDGHHWTNDDSAEAYTDSGYGSTNCCFALDQVKTPANKTTAKKAPAKSKAKSSKKDADLIQAASEAPASKPVVLPQGKAKVVKAKKAAAPKKSAAKSKQDDLKKIEGIGPKIAGLLNEAGIMTFADLSKASEKKLADVMQAAGARFRLAKHDTWQEQAKLAAAGKTDELKKLQDELKGGTRK